MVNGGGAQDMAHLCMYCIMEEISQLSSAAIPTPGLGVDFEHGM